MKLNIYIYIHHVGTGRIGSLETFSKFPSFPVDRTTRDTRNITYNYSFFPILFRERRDQLRSKSETETITKRRIHSAGKFSLVSAEIRRNQIFCY